MTLETQHDDGTLVIRRGDAAAGTGTHRVVVDIDAEEFTEMWLAGVEAADRSCGYSSRVRRQMRR